MRADDTSISSIVLFSPERFSGDWQVLESATQGCHGAPQHWRWDGTSRFTLSGVDCTGIKPTHLGGVAALTGPGARMMPDTGFGREPIWVLWVDQDYRIAVLGTPSGQFGQIIGRKGIEDRPDLRKAAREILEFNGYFPAAIGH
ncbi:hypothetical protein BFP70_11040 [Thioclava sp. SK-1]|nr:hypothetical protein BFP70_11040 [Thioclava sp. SK-1]